MLRPFVKPPLDPLAYRAAIDAMEAQRAAFQRYARTVEAQRTTLGDGDGDKAVAAADAVARDFVEISERSQQLEPLVRAVREGGSDTQLVELERQMEQLMQEARQAENAIRNMSTQLEAWRDAYGRQLSEVGMVPGRAEAVGDPAPPVAAPSGSGDAGAAGSGRGRGPYGARAAAGGRVTLIDRRG